ncbi:MAG: helix-turn-helix domain-containing protein, partial [Clostridia bacterium]|nr:helix-turn-helix domain-containing protein [Clostridia bacterium]
MANLNERENEKLDVIKKVLIGECTKKETSDSLGLTVRQIDRLLNKFKNEGEDGFVHKNRGKESKKKISLEIKKE